MFAVFVFELLLITFKSFALSSLLSEACVSKMIPGFLTIVPLLYDDVVDDDIDVLLHCNTVVKGDATDVTKIGGAIFVSVFVTDVIVSLVT